MVCNVCVPTMWFEITYHLLHTADTDLLHKQTHAHLVLAMAAPLVGALHLC